MAELGLIVFRGAGGICGSEGLASIVDILDRILRQARYSPADVHYPTAEDSGDRPQNAQNEQDASPARAVEKRALAPRLC